MENISSLEAILATLDQNKIRSIYDDPTFSNAYTGIENTNYYFNVADGGNNEYIYFFRVLL